MQDEELLFGADGVAEAVERVGVGAGASELAAVVAGEEAGERAVAERGDAGGRPWPGGGA